MSVHIGEKIKQRAKELRIGSTELGKLINTSKQNIYGIYKRKSTDSEMLRKLSKALDYDFFQYYNVETVSTVSEPTSHYGRKNKQAVSLEEYQKLKKELDDLKEKYELLKKINALLEKQKKK
jgi:hypothetical protein